MRSPHELEPGKKVKIRDLPTDADNFHTDRKAAEEEFEKLREELIQLQYRLYAENRRMLLVLFQAMDAGGKDGAIRHLFKGVNPQGVHVATFKAPSARDLAHDFLWRIHAQVPARGAIGVFNRSQYEDVLIARVDQLVPKQVWQDRYEQINRFEEHLTANGTTILKFYLHISKAEQKQRFEDRLKDPEKQWKFSLEDLEKRKQWDDYMEAYEDALNRCTTSWAPWYVIPSNQKWYRNLAVVSVVVDALRSMKLKVPKTDLDVSSIQVD
jgi:PPK2 family polyphosphate:nucleotide phosphotransferase